MLYFQKALKTTDLMTFPFYKQLDSKDCGPSCLKIISKYYSKHYSLKYLRELSYVTRSGTSIMGLCDAAEKIGYRTKSIRISWDQLAKDIPLPCIVHWNQEHFVVVYKIELSKGQDIFRKFLNREKCSDRIHISDPAVGLIKFSKEDFLKSWINNVRNDNKEGIALCLEPTPKFFLKGTNGKGNSPKVRYLFEYLRPYKKYLIQLFLGLIGGSIINLIFPFLTQSIVDVGIGNRDIAFIAMILIAQLALTLGQTANEFIKSWLTMHITTRVGISLISDFLAKLMRLPISFFDTKMIGDIMQRIGDHNRIQAFLTNSLISIIFALITMVVYSLIMATYNLYILGIFFAGSILHVLWVLIFLKKRRALDYKRFQQSSANQSNLIQLVTGMQEIKLNNCEKQKRWGWEKIQASLYNVRVKSLLLSQSQQIGATFLNQSKNIVISFIAARAVISGQMTLGMMMAIQYIIGQLNAPIQQFISFIQEGQDAKISLERLSEIHDKKDEVVSENGIKIEKGAEFDIKISNLCFQYEGPQSNKVLDNINLNIPSKKVTAIVGTSGSGKTTLIKLLLGFYNPSSGIIKLNDIPMANYDINQWRSVCGSVMQEGFIFSDSIAKNIGIIDEIPNSTLLNNAVTVANIKDYIESLPLKYNTKIGIEGHGLSTGQKQRILIARAIYKNPSFLFFDEATNALDAKNEKTIMNNLEKIFKGRTVVIVAHRLSTVMAADQIIVLDKGRIIEMGSHNKLVSNKGIYFNLVKDQLELGN